MSGSEDMEFGEGSKSKWDIDEVIAENEEVKILDQVYDYIEYIKASDPGTAAYIENRLIIDGIEKALKLIKNDKADRERENAIDVKANLDNIEARNFIAKRQWYWGKVLEKYRYTQGPEADLFRDMVRMRLAIEKFGPFTEESLNNIKNIRDVDYSVETGRLKPLYPFDYVPRMYFGEVPHGSGIPRYNFGSIDQTTKKPKYSGEFLPDEMVGEVLKYLGGRDRNIMAMLSTRLREQVLSVMTSKVASGGTKDSPFEITVNDVEKLSWVLPYFGYIMRNVALKMGFVESYRVKTSDYLRLMIHMFNDENTQLIFDKFLGVPEEMSRDMELGDYVNLRGGIIKLDLSNAMPIAEIINTSTTFFQDLMKLLSHNKTMTHLALPPRVISISPNGDQSVATMLNTNTTLKSLSLYIEDSLGGVFEVLRSNRTLDELKLFDASEALISGFSILLDSINRRGGLRSLGIITSLLGEKQIADFTRLLPMNTNIVALDFSSNQLSDNGTRILADWIRGNISIDHLNLSKNGIGNVGLVYLAKALAKRQRVMKYLEVSFNVFDEVGINELGSEFSNGLKIEKLGMSQLTEIHGSLLPFAESLKNSSVLRDLDFDIAQTARDYETHVNIVAKILENAPNLINLRINRSFVIYDFLRTGIIEVLRTANISKLRKISSGIINANNYRIVYDTTPVLNWNLPKLNNAIEEMRDKRTSLIQQKSNQKSRRRNPKFVLRRAPRE